MVVPNLKLQSTKGKRLYDKRAEIAKRDQQRELDREHGASKNELILKWLTRWIRKRNKK